MQTPKTHAKTEPPPVVSEPAKKEKKQRVKEPPPSVRDLWDCFVVGERNIPRMLDDMPSSTYHLVKRTSSPKVFGLGKRNFVLVDDLKEWLAQTRDQWEPRPAKRRYSVGA